jgi:hypothetical protein
MSSVGVNIRQQHRSQTESDTGFKTQETITVADFMKRDDKDQIDTIVKAALTSVEDFLRDNLESKTTDPLLLKVNCTNRAKCTLPTEDNEPYTIDVINRLASEYERTVGKEIPFSNLFLEVRGRDFFHVSLWDVSFTNRESGKWPPLICFNLARDEHGTWKVMGVYVDIEDQNKTNQVQIINDAREFTPLKVS